MTMDPISGWVDFPDPDAPRDSEQWRLFFEADHRRRAMLADEDRQREVEEKRRKHEETIEDLLLLLD